LATVFFTETVYHPGYFEVSWSTGGEAVADFSVVSGQIFQHSNPPNDVLRAWNFTYPDIACPANYCKLRVRMFMEDSGSNYYTCGDVELVDQSTYTSRMSACPTPCKNPTFINDTCFCDYWNNPNVPTTTKSISSAAGTSGVFGSGSSLGGQVQALCAVLLFVLLAF